MMLLKELKGNKQFQIKCFTKEQLQLFKSNVSFWYLFKHSESPTAHSYLLKNA